MQFKILLIQPPVEDFFFTPQRAYPLGLLYLATILEENGFKVKILNTLEDKSKYLLSVPPEFTYLKRYYKPNKSPFCLFANYWHYGLTDQAIKEQIIEFSPDVVGITANFTAYYQSVGRVCGIVKEVAPATKVVVGGRVATFCPKEVLSQANVDFVIRGEGEFAFLNFCQALKEAKPIPKEVCYREQGTNKIVINPSISIINDLDQLPFPKRDFINIKNYRFRDLLTTSLISSRGCPLNCAFCAVKEEFRYRSAKNVLNEIDYCYVLGIRHFNFEDDNIILNPQFPKILDLLLAKYKGKISLSFMNGVMSWPVSDLLTEKLLALGVTHWDFALVTSSNKLRKSLNRCEEIGDISKISNYMANKNIPSTIHFILGFPGQSFKDCLADIRKVSQERAWLGPSIFYPVIESKLGQDYPEWVNDFNNWPFFCSSCAYFDKDISKDNIFLLFYLCRIINFAKEIIDTLLIEDKSLFSFLEKRVNNLKLKIIEDKIITAKKLTKIDLGIVLLYQCLKYNTIFRIQLFRKQEKEFYHLFKEEFIDTNEFKDLLTDLNITALSGRKIKVRGCQGQGTDT